MIASLLFLLATYLFGVILQYNTIPGGGHDSDSRSSDWVRKVFVNWKRFRLKLYNKKKNKNEIS